MPTVPYESDRLLTTMLVDPAVAPPVTLMIGAIQLSPPVPRVTTPPLVPVAFRIVKFAPAPRNVTFEGMLIDPVIE